MANRHKHENPELDQATTVETSGADEGQQYEQPTQQEWRDALAETVKQRDEYLSMAQRTQAEFQNFRKRNETTRADAYDDGVRDTLSLMLPSIDNLDRAIESACAQGEGAALLEGIEMTRRLMLEAAAKLGMEEVPALGERFDPELHNAVMRADGGDPGMILEVFQKGYRARGRILRYPMVKVAAE